MSERPSVDEMVTKIRRDCMFWAPEVRVMKLNGYLVAYGVPLADALRALPESDREACGIDRITRG